MILPSTAKPGSPCALTSVKMSTKQILEKITEPGLIGLGKISAAEFETGIPTRRRLKILPGLPVLSELIVGRTFFRVFQYFVCFADFLKIFLGV